MLDLISSKKDGEQRRQRRSYDPEQAQGKCVAQHAQDLACHDGIIEQLGEMLEADKFGLG
ncbi:hypothetical protein [Cohnella rhizosphaerae]|uniref:hypothetical protein n=1 Tax=Cohnella rhizosphaerae TaxID=1457232 RepID=UPI0024069FD2|nr:hypothetical protein [Cohnella rhizosphaerae]